MPSIGWLRHWAILLACLETVLGTTSSLRERNVCRAKGRSVIEAKFANETYWLCLKLISLDSTNIANSRTALLLDPDAEETKHMIRGLPVTNIHMARGYPLSDSVRGSAEGYIAEDHQFYGLLHINNRTLHADPYGTDDPKRTFGFSDDTLETAKRHVRDDKAQMPYFDFKLHHMKRKSGVARARICELLLLADRMFLQVEANGSLSHAVMRMANAVDQADVIFRNADFDEDGVPDNIGFSIKYIIVLASNETNSRVFGNLLDEHAVSGHQYLLNFARLRRLADVCLGVAFSGHAFLNRTLGLSFTSLGGGLGFAAGGICDRRALGRSFNTIALSHAVMEPIETFRVPERMVALTLAHEMGHSFGAHHDDSFPNPECRAHLMSAQSAKTAASRSYEFSFCSKRLIAATVAGMGYCLLEEVKPFCGNGIVETGEECDCGHPSSCVERDLCCTPRSGSALLLNNSLENEGCMVAAAAQCHPSQGFCCGANCQFANLIKHGINCTELKHGCDCSVTSTPCRCGLGGLCLDGTCHAAECAKLGLKECKCSRARMEGVIRANSGCGICCRIPSTRSGASNCLGAESAARHFYRTNRPIPKDWPDEEYRGPNVTIKLCPQCPNVTLRAWPQGGYCVSRNQVGFCSNKVCRPGERKPRRNIYPQTQGLKLSSYKDVQNAGCSQRSKLLNYIGIIISLLFLKHLPTLRMFVIKL